MTPAPSRLQRWTVTAALVLTIPAFYAELLLAVPSVLADIAYGLAAMTVLLTELPRWRADLAATQGSTRLRARLGGRHLLVLALITGLVGAAALPPSLHSTAALTLRLITAILTLAYMLWSLQHLLARGSLPVLLALALTVLFLCGVGFWWLEPGVTTLADGLWLAFTTAATVGYGDLVPTTAASKIFSVFVVLLGYGVLSLVTAAIASTWVESSERALEQQMMRDLHQEVSLLRSELARWRAVQTPLPVPPHGPDRHRHERV
ncbi:voltage-gated potassium channel [Sphaerotilus hippei]|uniref:Voltage-gated potassium channel n=2 Tax=Sphaerotilus hippei TaxID=744406 RepID=A0A318GZH9_9BURK|nr:voltage-gated potassium channel [Sphaerotilus hippei]